MQYDQSLLDMMGAPEKSAPMQEAAQTAGSKDISHVLADNPHMINQLAALGVDTTPLHNTTIADHIILASGDGISSQTRKALFDAGVYPDDAAQARYDAMNKQQEATTQRDNRLGGGPSSDALYKMLKARGVSEAQAKAMANQAAKDQGLSK